MDQHKFGFANWYQVFPSHALVCPLCKIFENNPQMQKWHSKEETKTLENPAKH